MKFSVSYDSKSFIIDGRRRFLSSGAVHYFRTPHELWRDRLLKSRQAGLNTIETYVPWNFHESKEGRFEFSGDHDLDAFFALCEELGLYIIVRPGPYICSEWDFGGFPNWLIGKPGIELRTDNPIFLQAVDRWFDRLVPIIAKHQRTRGGGVILVQVENEYSHAAQGDNTGERGRAYMEHLRNGLVERGIEVPLLTCSGSCPGCLDCANGHNPADFYEAHKAKQPKAPFFSTEFWSAWYDVWGCEHHSRFAEDLEYQTMRIIARGGGGYNYYMWHGGTNFGYSTMYRQTTSYDFHAPLSEAGRPTDNYRACKRAADFAQEFAEILTAAEAGETESFGADPRLLLFHRVARKGSLLFLENPTDQTILTPIHLCENEPKLSIAPRSVQPVLMGYPIGSETRIVFSTATLRAVLPQGDTVYCLVSGPAGEEGSLLLEIKGDLVPILVRFPESMEVSEISRGPVTLVIMNEALAARTWHFRDGRKRVAVVGPSLVHSCELARNNVTLEMEHDTESLETRVYGLKAPLASRISPQDHKPVLPALSEWYALPGSPEVERNFEDSEWTAIGEPKSMIALGNGSNAYGWYHTGLMCGVDMKTTIRFSECADMLTLWVNGVRVGRSEAPPEDRTLPWSVEFPISLRAGCNRVVVLADNLGLAKGAWQIGRPMEQEAKGIFGEVMLGDGRVVDEWRFVGRLDAERRNLMSPRSLKSAPWLPREQMNPIRKDRIVLWAVEFALPKEAISPEHPIFIRMDGMGKGVIWLNGHNLGRYWQIGPQRDYYAPEPWLKRKNLLVIAEEDGYTPEQVSLIYDEKGTAVPIKLNLK